MSLVNLRAITLGKLAAATTRLARMIAMGAHVDQTDPIAQARARGAPLSQLFLGDPQGWKGPKVAYAGGAAGLKSDAEAAGIALFVHAPYVLNVASTNNRIRIPSRQHLQKQLTAAAEIGAAGVIVHGGHLNAGEDPEVGFSNWFKAVDGLDIAVRLLIENTAGGNNAMTRHLERIDRLWTAIGASANAGQVGFCLDTCHAHAGGNELFGLVDLIHANDARDPFDSGADRHANWGTGFCDPEGVADVLRSAGAPVVIETPGGVEDHVRDLAWLADRL